MNSILVFVRQHRSELLMWLFIGLLVASPVADAHPRIGFAMSLVFFAATLYGATFMVESRIVVRVVLPLVALWMLSHVLELFVGRYYFSPYIGLALSCAVVVGIVSKFEDKCEVTRNLIAEAVIGYLVIAVAFSQVYWILNRTFANAFTPPVSHAESSTYLYFSLTTLTTVGFGDVQPLNHYVRFIAAFEGVLGVFYLAVVIARLVSGYRSSR
jgi:voltage-gated potassium channel